jgi:uncharacterized membrane protein
MLRFGQKDNLALILGVLLEDLEVETEGREVEEALKVNPDYPSLRSLSDTLDEWLIPNMAVEISYTQLREIPYPALAHCKSGEEYYVLLRRFEDEQIVYTDGRKSDTVSSIEDFRRIWSGIVLLVEPNNSSRNPKKSKSFFYKVAKKYILSIVIISLVLLVVGLSNSILSSNIFLTLLLGLISTLFLLQNEFGEPNSIVTQLCRFNKKTDCDSIVKSSASKLFGWLSWSEIGFLYFAGSMLSVVFSFISAKTGGILLLLFGLNILALPYTIFSVYYQAFVAKKWCTLCLIVQAVLWMSFVLLLNHPLELGSLDDRSVAVVVIGFLLPVAIWFLFKPFLIQARQLPGVKKEAARFYRNSELFVASLEKQRVVEVGLIPNEVILGNPKADLEIVIVCGVFCYPCAEAHHELDALTDYYGEDLKLIIRFVADNDMQTERSRATQHILSLDSTVQAQAIKDWFMVMDYDKWSVQYPIELSPMSEKLLRSQNHWCETMQITHTPTIFINGHQLTEPFSYKQLKYHVRSLIEVGTYV